MTCPACGHENPPGQKFCGDCGARLSSQCSGCGATNPPGQKFCGECGRPLASAPAPAPSRSAEAGSRFSSSDLYTPRHLVERILTSKTAVEGERKQVTVLFADMKGSMELLADRDPEEARKILRHRPAHRGLRAAGAAWTHPRERPGRAGGGLRADGGRRALASPTSSTSRLPVPAHRAVHRGGMSGRGPARARGRAAPAGSRPDAAERCFRSQATSRGVASRSPSSCGRRRASRVCSSRAANATRRAGHSPMSTAGSPRGSRLAISGRPSRCSTPSAGEPESLALRLLLPRAGET